jgi:protocatechuate 3,4-dioxygenase beta subunit
MRVAPKRIALALAAVAVVAGWGIVFFARTWGSGGTTVTAGDGGVGKAAIQAPRRPQLPDGGVRLTGTVTDGAGMPVAGALVSAQLEKGLPDRALSRDAGAGTSDGGSPSWSVSPPAPYPTGPDGRFAIDGLEPGRYRLRVTGTGLLAAELRFVPVPSDEARVVVARQISIEGTVTDGGKPVLTATVGLRGEAIGGTLETKTDTHGAFHVPNLPEGRYQIFAYQGALAARTVRVARLGSGPFEAVELRLEAGAIVVGRVIDRGEGTPLAAAIELRPSGEDQAPRFARAGEDGTFRIEGVPTGRWIADAYAPGYLSPGGVELEAGRGVPELALERGGAIEGRVLDGDGRPIAGATVRALTSGTSPVELSAEVERDRLRRYSGRTAASTSDVGTVTNDPQLLQRGELGVMIGPIPPLPSPGSDIARAAAVVDPNAAAATAGLLTEPPALAVDEARASIWVTGADGRYRIRGFSKAKATVLAGADGFAEARSREVPIDAGQVITGVDVVLTAGTYLVGKVTDQRGAPVIGAEVAAAPKVGAPLAAFSDESGEYRLGPLSGAAELRASAYGHVEVRREIELAAVKGATAGERREDFVLEVADATLAGTVEDSTGVPVKGAQLEVVDGAGERRHATAAADGTFSIDLLPRGHVRVRVEHPEYPAAELDAIASVTSERVHLRLAIGGAVEGALLDASSGAPLAGQTLAARGPSGQTTEMTTDKAGLWKLGPLQPGRWQIDARLPGYLAQTRELDVPASRAPGLTSVRDVRIDLARGALVGGTVRDRRGQRVSGAHVAVRAADGSGPVVEGDADVAGEFRVHDCPTGDIVVSATRGDETGMARTTVRGGDEVLSLSIELQ